MTIEESLVPNDSTPAPSFLEAQYAKLLLQDISTWGHVATIIVHGGCVFEFKGDFPRGEEGSGYYNLKGGGSSAASAGFEGHLNLEKIARIEFQDTPHRGKESYAFVFMNSDNDNIFKVFVGRDEHGELLPRQVARFKSIQGDADVLLK